MDELKKSKAEVSGRSASSGTSGDAPRNMHASRGHKALVTEQLADLGKRVSGNPSRQYPSRAKNRKSEIIRIIIANASEVRLDYVLGSLAYRGHCESLYRR